MSGRHQNANDYMAGEGEGVSLSFVPAVSAAPEGIPVLIVKCGERRQVHNRNKEFSNRPKLNKVLTRLVLAHLHRAGFRVHLDNLWSLVPA